MCWCVGILTAKILFFLRIRRPPRSTPFYSSAASDVYKRQVYNMLGEGQGCDRVAGHPAASLRAADLALSLIHISEHTRHPRSSYAVFCFKKKNNNQRSTVRTMPLEFYKSTPNTHTTHKQSARHHRCTPQSTAYNGLQT